MRCKNNQNYQREREWKKLIQEVNNNVCGKGCKILCKIGYDGRPKTQKRKKLIGATYITNADTIAWEPFTVEKLKIAVKKMQNGKAPSSDGITVELKE